MWWACGAGSYTVAGLPAELRNNGWESFAENVMIPRFTAFNDDDEARCLIHMPFGRNRAQTGDLEFDALLMRRQQREFPLVYDIDGFRAGMDAFFEDRGQYPELYFGTLHGSEYNKWHRLSPAAFRSRVLDSLEPLLCIPRAHRKIIIDTMGVFGLPASRRFPGVFQTRNIGTFNPDRRSRRSIGAGISTGTYKSGSTNQRSRFAELLKIINEIGVAGVGIEPRARLDSGWELGGPTVDWWTTSQLMDSANDTESGTGAGWCLAASRCEGQFGVLLTDSRTESQIATWIQGDKAVAIGGLSDPGVTSSEMAAYSV